MPYVLNQADGFQSVVQIDQKSLIEFKARYFVPLEAALDKKWYSTEHPRFLELLVAFLNLGN